MKAPRTTPRTILGASLLLGALQITGGCSTDAVDDGDDQGPLTMRSVSSGDAQYAQIIAGWNSNYCLDVAGLNATNNGKNVQLWQCDQVTETWNLGTDGKIHAGWSSNVCLDVAGTNATANGTNVAIWQCNQVTETWTLGLDGKLRAQWDTSICLDIYGTNESTNGKNAKIWQCDDAVVETWSMRTSTGWLDSGTPGAVGSHDWEKLGTHIGAGNIPSEMVGIEPAYVEMRLIATGEDISQTGDLKNLSTQYGGKARNEVSNPIEGDYEIQFHYGWTPWVNRDTDPSDGDDETHTHYTNWTKYTGPTTSVGSVLTGRMPPRNPTRTECRVVNEPTTIYSSDDAPDVSGFLTASWSGAGSPVKFRCDNEVGYLCDDADQDPGVTCSEDVEVRHFFGYEELCWGDTADATDNGACEPRAAHGESCLVDSDCETEVCDLAQLACANCTAIPQNGCDFGTEYCELDACHDKMANGNACAFDDQCQSGICDAFICVECTAIPEEGCDFDAQYCEFGSCHDKKTNGNACAFDDQCQSGICDEVAFTCVECTAIPQAGCDFGSQYCELSTCYDKKQVMDPCTIEMDDQCLSDDCRGMGAAMLDYRCSDDCSSDADCNGGTCDVTGRCNTIECGAPAPGLSCPSGEFCNALAGTCDPKKANDQLCATNDECQSNVCDHTTWTCEQCTAVPEAGCNFGSQYCEGTTCHNKKGNGSSCAFDDQCQSGICDAFTCVACTAVPQEGCNFGSQYCEFSSCHNKKSNGSACGFSDQCQSNNCFFFVCV